jgi:hypothetical protein
MLLAVAAAIVLCLPRLGLGYFWDDYIFLTSGQANPAAFLTINPTTIFYRPVSMGAYFLLLGALGPNGALVGHMLNLALLALSIVLLGTLVKRIAGPRAGLIAALAYATLSSSPSLVAWITASQDLLAIVFALVAFHMRQSDRPVETFTAAALALLSKETAVSMLPALVLWPRILGRKPDRLPVYASLCGALLLLWGAIHPGVHAFLAHGFSSSATGYVRAGNPESWPLKAGRYMLLLFNLPTGYPASWPRDLTVDAAAALLLLLAAIRIAPRTSSTGKKPPRVPMQRALALAALIALPPIALDTALVRHWAPYYVALPGIGAAFLLGVLLSRAPKPLVPISLAAYLALGVWARGISAPTILAFTEENFRAASRATRELESEFRTFHPEFPHRSQLLVSVEQTGTLGMTQTIHQGQAAKVWYDDPTLETLLPEQMLPARDLEFLFRVTSGLDLLEIDPDRMVFRSGKGRPPHPDEIGRTIRSYARGLAATGDPERASKLLTHLAQVDGGLLRDYDIRLLAMIRLSRGDAAGGESLKAIAPVSREFAIDMVGKIYAEPSSDPSFDATVFPAFDISPSDTTVVRRLMRLFRDSGYLRQAYEFAERTIKLVPGDREAAAILRSGRPPGVAPPERSGLRS